MSDTDSEACYGGLSRNQYLMNVSKEYNVSYALVLDFANFLGPDEDFDGLLCELDDYVNCYD